MSTIISKMSKLIKQDISVDSNDNRNSSSSIPLLQEQKQQQILYNKRTNNIDNNDDLIVDQMTHLTLFHDNMSNSPNKAKMDKNNGKNDRQVDSDELINLIDDLSVSYKQAPFMPYCL